MDGAVMHPKAFEIAKKIRPNPFSWLYDKQNLIDCVDQVTSDITAGETIEPTDTFAIGIAGKYAAQVLVSFRQTLNWKHAFQSPEATDALLSFLAERWLFFKVTGKLR